MAQISSMRTQLRCYNNYKLKTQAIYIIAILYHALLLSFKKMTQFVYNMITIYIERESH